MPIDIAIALMIGCFGFGYGLACRSARKDLEKVEANVYRILGRKM
jgi:hypothetical protein